jgi:hypothetical protein
MIGYPYPGDEILSNRHKSLFRSIVWMILTRALMVPGSSYADCPRKSIKNSKDTQNMISEEHITSVSAFVNCLPEEYRKYYTLVYHSKSPEREDVSFETPRVISFGETGKLIFAYTGKPKENGGKHSHTLQFIDFSSGKADTFQVDFTDSNSINQSFAHKNPRECMACHDGPGGSFRPIWADYPMWPGVYGSVDDLFLDEKKWESMTEQKKKSYLFRDFLYLSTVRGPVSDPDSLVKDRKSYSKGKYSSFSVSENKRLSLNAYVRSETEEYEKFIVKSKKNPVYRDLVLNPGYKWAKKSPVDKLSSEFSTLHRMNLVLTDLLGTRASEEQILQLKNSEAENEFIQSLAEECKKPKEELGDNLLSMGRLNSASSVLEKVLGKDSTDLRDHSEDIEEEIFYRYNHELDTFEEHYSQTFSRDGSYEMPFILPGGNEFTALKSGQDHLIFQYLQDLARRHLNQEQYTQMMEGRSKSQLKDALAYEGYIDQKKSNAHISFKLFCQKIIEAAEKIQSSGKISGQIYSKEDGKMPEQISPRGDEVAKITHIDLSKSQDDPVSEIVKNKCTRCHHQDQDKSFHIGGKSWPFRDFVKYALPGEGKKKMPPVGQPDLTDQEREVFYQFVRAYK